MTLFAEIYDGDLPPKKDAWKTIAPKQPVEIDELCKGTTTGASVALVKQIETDDWINQLAQGAPAAMTKRDSTLLSDEFMSKTFLDSSILNELFKSESFACKCECAKCKAGTCTECTSDTKCALFGGARSEKTVKECRSKEECDQLDRMMLKMAGVTV